MRYIYLLICIFALTPLYSNSVQAQPTLADFGKLPDIEEASVSPDGTKYALLAKANGVRSLVVIENRKLLRTLPVNDEKVRGLSWADDNLIMLTLSRTEDLSARFNVKRAEMSRTIFVATNISAANVLFAKQKQIAPINMGFYGLREVGGKRYGYFASVLLKRDTFGANVTDLVFVGGSPDLYQVDLQDFSVKKIARSSPDIKTDDSWLIGADGELVATLRIFEKGGWRLKGHKNKVKIEGKQSEGRVRMVGLLNNGNSLVFGEAPAGKHKLKYYKVNLESGAKEPYLEKESPAGFYVNNLTGEIFGYDDEDENSVFFDPAMSERRAKIERAFPKLNYQIVDYDDDFTKVVLETDGNRDSGTFWQVDLTKLRASPLGYQRTNILPKHVGKISTVEYKAADGLPLDGILTLPPGKEAKNLPVIMLPHGGPRAHDEEVFDWWAQGLAWQGYAVFQPNFRGSTNRDQAFVEAGYGEWGRKMQTDISDGLAHLAKQGIVDPKRACIVGASYGGYAALAGVTLQKDIYRCAVSVNGVSDLSMMISTDRKENLNNRMLMQDLYRMVGKGKELKTISPRKFATHANAPILLIHGKDDVVVPFRQSEVMAKELKRVNKPHNLIVLNGEDHWLSKGETRLTMLKALSEFVQQHNPAN